MNVLEKFKKNVYSCSFDKIIISTKNIFKKSEFLQIDGPYVTFEVKLNIKKKTVFAMLSFIQIFW